MKFVNSAFSTMAVAIVMGGQRLCAAASGPCDIYQAGGTPCIAAHSTVRALYAAYSGNLYQVRRSSDNDTLDIGVLNPGGAANSAAQDQFCKGTSCVITILYDQSGKGNFMDYQGSGSAVGGSAAPAPATTESFNLSGQKVYSLYINPGNTYWSNGSATGVPTGSAPEGLYMVTSGTHVNGGCCFDYGNSETTRTAVAAGAMDAIYFGTSCWFGSPTEVCTGTGPWVQADLEWGLFSGGSSAWNTNQKSFTNKYVTAMLKNNGTTQFMLKGANAQSGSLSTLWSGSLPSGYSPMKKEGAIVLGSGGDCCKAGGGVNQSLGTFYEGAIVSGYPSNATDSEIQVNIVAAGYGSNTSAIADVNFGGSRTSVQYDASNGKAVVGYSLATSQSVRLRVLDLQGREVARLVDGTVAAGVHGAVWDARQAHSGVYVLAMQVGGKSAWSGTIVVHR